MFAPHFIFGSEFKEVILKEKANAPPNGNNVWIRTLLYYCLKQLSEYTTLLCINQPNIFNDTSVEVLVV